ncbi:uncharacterized protein LOC143294522 [Babylonia areolata]|uniref:uncharacterized protein LOC143294522 n=1 Tax=Babylonia areolata TaxID=304850 RepID=UPI003FD36F28
MGVNSFQARPLSYKVSAVLSIISWLLLLVGVASPYWHQSAGGTTYGGLWSRCDADSGSCTDQTAEATEGWWVGVQVLEALSLLCVTVSCSALLFENCFSQVTAPFLLHQLTGLLGGLLGIIGCILFVAKTEPLSEDVFTTYSWSFYFAILGDAVFFLFTIVIIVGGKTARKSHSLHQADNTVSPGPVRRFSHLWARESPATPEGARRAMATAKSRDAEAASFPAVEAPSTLQPVYEAKNSSVVAGQAENEDED